MFAADAPTFLADIGETVSWIDSVSAVARAGLMLFDQPDADLQGGQALSREYEVTFETTAWQLLRRGELLVIGGAGGGASYRLRTDPHQAEDGVFSKAKLSKV